MKSRPRRAARAPSRGAPAWPRAAAVLAPALLALALYLPSLAGGFVRDDHDLIGRHAVRRAGPAALPAALLADFHRDSGGGSGKWRPLVTLSYAIDGTLGGWSPRIFHASNLLAHGAVVALLVLLLLQAGVPRLAAALVGAWFAAAAVHVETVAWIAARTDLHAALFVLAALWADGRRRREDRAGPGWLAPGLFALALLAKETALAALAVFAAAAWSDASRRPVRPWRWIAPYVLVAMGYLAGWIVIGGVPARPDYLDPERAAALLRGAAWTIPALLRFVLPGVPHAPDWPLPASASTTDPRVALGLAATLALGLGALLAARRGRAAAVPLALAVAPLVPPALGAALQVAGGTVMAERLVYLASAGAVWLAALGSLALLEAAGARRAAAGAVLTALALAVIAIEARATWRDQAMYHDDAALYAAMAERVPGHATGWVGLATVRMREGRLAEALRLLERAEALDPRIPEIHQARAEIAFAEARWADAAAAARREIALEPERPYPRVLEAAARVRMGEGRGVLATIDSLWASAADDPMLLAARGEARLAAGRAAEAVDDLDRALQLAPGDPFTALALARALRAGGEEELARRAIVHAVRLAPGLEAGWALLAESAAARGATAERDTALARLAALRAARP